MQFSKIEMSCINLGKMVTSNSLHWHKKEESSSKCNSKEQRVTQDVEYFSN